MNSRYQIAIPLILTACFPVGCGRSESPNQTGSAELSTPIVPPIVSIEANRDTSSRDQNSQEISRAVGAPTQGLISNSVSTSSAIAGQVDSKAKKTVSSNFEIGSAMWLISEISRIRSAPKDRVAQPDSQNPNGVRVVQLTPEQTLQEQNRRHREIIELAQQAIVKTHNDPAQIQLFNSAVDALSDARLQLAISGDEQQARLLENDAETLFQKDPQSFSAMESSYRVLQFAQSQAQRYSAQDSKWAIAFANQAKLYASRFPQESGRSAIHLLAAGRMCDTLGMQALALSCLSVVEQQFPDSPYAGQVTGMLRRLRLPGQQLVEFAGSTLRGSHVEIQKFHGTPVIVAFWASNSETFRNDLLQMRQVFENANGKVAGLGVCLDRDEVRAARFVESSLSGWEHIFYSDHNKRGVKNVIADYYGVSKIPTYWLIDSNGVVVSVDLPIERLDQAVADLLTSQSAARISLSRPTTITNE